MQNMDLIHRRELYGSLPDLEKMPKPHEKDWFAIYTRSRAEKRVSEDLQRFEIECYLPMRHVVRQWSDRRKKVEEPVIRSYVFVRVHPRFFSSVYISDHVVGYVKYEGKPAIIPKKQIEALMRIVESEVDYTVNTDHIKKGQAIKVKYGPLKGLEGELVNIASNKRFIVRINHIGYSLIVNIPPDYLDI